MKQNEGIRTVRAASTTGRVIEFNFGRRSGDMIGQPIDTGERVAPRPDYSGIYGKRFKRAS